jgi:hypothetical protein
MPLLLLVLLAGSALGDAERREAENEIRAAVVEEAVAADVKGGSATFTLTVEGDPDAKGLRRALARRGLKPSKDGRRQLRLGLVVWTAGDMATVSVVSGTGEDSSGITYVVVLRDGRWTVSGTRGGWITEGPRPPGSFRTADARAAGRRAAPAPRGGRASWAG